MWGNRTKRDKPSIEDFKHFIKPLKDSVISKLVYDTIHKRKDGSTYPISVSLEYHSDEAESAFVAFSQDITERLAMEQSLKEETENLAAFFQNAPEPMTISGMDTTILQANSAYAKIVGINAVDMIGLKFIDFMQVHYCNDFLHNLATASPENPLFSSLQEKN
jgi:PAS domain-containing protein